MHNLWRRNAIFLIFMMDNARFSPCAAAALNYTKRKINEKVDL